MTHDTETPRAAEVAAVVERPFCWVTQHEAREIAMPASRSRDTRVYRVPQTQEGEALVALYSWAQIALLLDALAASEALATRLKGEVERAVADERDRCRRIAKAHGHHALWIGILDYGWNEATETFGRALAQRIAASITEPPRARSTTTTEGSDNVEN